MSGLEHAAAVIAAAFVASKQTDSDTAEKAAEVYFDCLCALNKEYKKRDSMGCRKATAPAVSGDYRADQIVDKPVKRTEVIRGHEAKRRKRP